MRKVFLFVGLGGVWFALTAATEASQTTALAIAGVVAVLLPLVLKAVPAAGHWMVGITLAASLVVAVISEWISGELVLSNLQGTDVQALFTLFLSVWGLSQIVYATLSQSPKTAGAVQ